MEYSNLQKERIANHILEHYKDGKYEVDDTLKRQSQTHYNKKSEIMGCIDKWSRDDKISKYIIPILDANLENDYESLENEWSKNHLLQIQIGNLKEEVNQLKGWIDMKAIEKAKEMQLCWVSDNEDVEKLHEEIEELKNRKDEMIRRHRSTVNGLANQNNQLSTAVQRMEDSIREKHVATIESEMASKKEEPSLKKEIKKLEQQNNKLERDNLSFQKKKMQDDMKFLELKSKSEMMNGELRSEVEKLRIQNEYFKIKDSAHQHPHLQLVE